MSLSDFAESSELIPELFSPNPFYRLWYHDLQARKDTLKSSDLILKLFRLNPLIDNDVMT